MEMLDMELKSQLNVLWNWYRSTIYKNVFQTTAFDCIARLKYFCTMTLIISGLLFSICNHELDSDGHSTILIFVYYAIQWMATFLLQCGWVLAMTAEFCAVIFNRPSSFLPQFALYTSIVTLTAGLLSSLLLLLFVDILVAVDSGFRLRVLFWQSLACTSIQLWGLGCVMAFTPRDFLVRMSQDGEPAKYLRLLVWYNMDICILVSSVGLSDFIFPFHDPLQDNAWPKLAETPRWILRKLLVVLPEPAPAG